jgi:6-phosphogluconolactonase
MTAPLFDVYFGTYTKASSSEGIYHASFNPESGHLSAPMLAGSIPDPAFLEIHPNARYLYAVTEQVPGSISAFEINPVSKNLKWINTVAAEGTIPCHLCIATDGRTLFVGNYGSGSLANFPINPDGSLGNPACTIQHAGSSLHPKRQTKPYVHSVNLSPDNRFAYVADLGTDKIAVYQFNAETRTLQPNTPPSVCVKPGAGPRHFCFAPSGKFAYLINELDETVIAFSHDARTGNLTELQTLSTLPAGWTGNTTCAEVKVHPSGKFLYGSNRGHDSIVTYQIDPVKGTLTLAGFQTTGIKTPRHFNIDPTGQFCLVANQDADTVLVFRIDLRTGLLEPSEQVVKMGRPVCVRFIQPPSKKHPL